MVRRNNSPKTKLHSLVAPRGPADIIFSIFLFDQMTQLQLAQMAAGYDVSFAGGDRTVAGFSPTGVIH